jgi:transposase
MAKVGRPTSLTPEVRDRIVQAVRAGSYISHAAEYAGVSRESVHGWIARGRAERDRLTSDPKAKPDPNELIYAEFFHTVTRAEAEAVIEAVAAWKQAGRSDWRAAKEWLARRHGEEWGDRAKIEHTGIEAAPITLAGLHALLEADDNSDAG